MSANNEIGTFELHLLAGFSQRELRRKARRGEIPGFVGAVPREGVRVGRGRGFRWNTDAPKFKDWLSRNMLNESERDRPGRKGHRNRATLAGNASIEESDRLVRLRELVRRRNPLNIAAALDDICRRLAPTLARLYPVMTPIQRFLVQQAVNRLGESVGLVPTYSDRKRVRIRSKRVTNEEGQHPQNT